MSKFPKGITPRGDKFRVSIMVGGSRRTGTCDTLEEALELSKNIRSGLEVTATSDGWTLPQALDSYIEGHLLPGDYSEGTIIQYTNRMDCLTRFFGETTPLDEVTAKDFVLYSATMRRDRKMVPSTINTDLTILCTIMRHARKMGGMVREIPEKPRFKQKQKEPRFLTKAEEDMILAYFSHIGDDLMCDLIILLVDTGMRVDSEALSLPAKFVNLLEGTVTVWKSKSSQPRKIPLTDRAKEALERRTKETGGDPFHRHTYQQVQKKWKAMRKALGHEFNKDWTLHICRHTFCTRLVSGGIDLRTVQVLAGHENIKTTMTYAHFVPDNMFKALEVLQGKPENVTKLNVIK